MTSFEKVALAAGLTLSLGSCADGNALTESRARDLMAKTVRYYPCVGFNVEPSSEAVYVGGAAVDVRTFLSNNDPFPITVAVARRDQPISGDTLNTSFRRLQRAGLATSKPAGSITADGGTKELRTYELSDLGRSMFQIIENGSGKVAFGFCWGKGQVVELLDYAPPAKGEKSKKVTFRWNTVDSKGNPLLALPDGPWTKVFFGPRPPLLDGERTATLTLSDRGWEMVR